MTVTNPEFVIRIVLGDPILHSLAEVLVVLCLVAVLVVREMVRYRSAARARTIVPSLTALSAPLLVAWALVAAERLLRLAGG